MFAMKLALAVGRADVDAMLDEITEREFRDWMAYDRIQPFGAERDDIRMALGFAAMCNTWGGKVKVESFMPFTDYDQGEIETRRQIDKARKIALQMGASPE